MIIIVFTLMKSNKQVSQVYNSLIQYSIQA